MTFRALFFFVIAGVGLGACASSKTSDALEDQHRSEENAEIRQCGQTDEEADFGDFTRGAIVRLHAQDEDEEVPANWSPDMEHYVGKVTRVTEALGVDASGCPGVRVEADGGVFFWRIRDLQRVEDDADNDRCGQNEATANYLDFNEGDRVIIQNHRPWYDQENWVSEMDAFVGQKAIIESHSGVDAAGCPGVTLDIDDGQYFWRVRDLKSAR